MRAILLPLMAIFLAGCDEMDLNIGSWDRYREDFHFSYPLSTGGSFVKGKGEVEMRTLDSFAFENIDCCKLDCEGFEEFVLRGGESMITKWKPVICVEQKRDFPVKFGLKPLGAVKFLVDRGYRVVGELSGDYILKVPG